MQVLSKSFLEEANSDHSLDPIAGITILIDKPLEWTSFDVVNKLRHRLRNNLGIKKIKVGHAGTLDPLATGLVIVCTGKLTKSIDDIQAFEKEYIGHITLGATTATYDSEVPPDQFYPTEHITLEKIDEVRKGFIGVQEQVPPIYSAIKINGSKAYNLARRGKEVEMKARSIRIDTFEIDGRDFPKLEFTVKCSKGTYIRSLAHDLGVRLESGGYLSSLRRTKIGEFDIENSLTIEEAIQAIEIICPRKEKIN
jgi:tRNA pseudouridine55 synthase